MTRDKSPKSSGVSTRDRVLGAAERLLAQGSANFSMRELAEEAGVSFATPFNQFGGKAAIMLALSGERIALMRERLGQATLPESAVTRVLLAVDIAAFVMLETPSVSRAVMAAISAPSDEPSAVSANSSAFWADALGGGEGLMASARPLAMTVLPDQLAVAFRGVLSFWTAGDIPDQSLQQCARAAAAAILLGFAGRDERVDLVSILETAPAFARV